MTAELSTRNPTVFPFGNAVIWLIGIPGFMLYRIGNSPIQLNC